MGEIPDNVSGTYVYPRLQPSGIVSTKMVSVVVAFLDASDGPVLGGLETMTLGWDSKTLLEENA